MVGRVLKTCTRPVWSPVYSKLLQLCTAIAVTQCWRYKLPWNCPIKLLWSCSCSNLHFFESLFSSCSSHTLISPSWLLATSNGHCPQLLAGSNANLITALSHFSPPQLSVETHMSFCRSHTLMSPSKSPAQTTSGAQCERLMHWRTCWRYKWSVGLELCTVGTHLLLPSGLPEHPCRARLPHVFQAFYNQIWCDHLGLPKCIGSGSSLWLKQSLHNQYRPPH